MEKPQFVIVKPGLQRKKTWTESTCTFIPQRDRYEVLPPHKSVKFFERTGIIEGYKAGELGLVSPKIKEFYKQHGFDYTVRKKGPHFYTELNEFRPRVTNDSVERPFSSLSRYSPHSEDILVLTYDPEQKIDYEVEERYSLLPLRNEEIIQIGNPATLDELMEKYEQNHVSTNNPVNLSKSYVWLKNFNKLEDLIDIGEIPIRISTRV